MKRLMVFIAALAILFAAQNSRGQATSTNTPNNPLPDWVRRVQEKRREIDRINGRTPDGMIANRRNGRIPSRRRTNPDGKPYSREEIERIRKLMEPDAADSAKYADFLKHSKTGLFRLFTFFDCEDKNSIRVDGDCANYIPGSWAYSFRVKDYSNSTFFDLKFEDGNLVTGSMLSLGILASLGNVPVENVSLASDGMKYLAELKPAAEQKECEKQFAEFGNGVESGGYKYSVKIKAEENMTYALRVVAYRLPDSVNLRLISKDIPEPAHSSPFPLNDFDSRRDVIIVFRIVRRDADNATILWKELRRADAPKIVFPKDVKSLTVESKSG